MCTTISSTFQGLSGSVTGIANGIGSALSGAWNSMKTAATSAFNSLKQIISDKVNAALNVVRNVASGIKNAFNFSWSLPPLKLPHISVSGGEAPFGIGGKGSLPQFHIAWYARSPRDREAVIILGSGPNRIGQGIEFDYTCVHAVQGADLSMERP